MELRQKKNFGKSLKKNFQQFKKHLGKLEYIGFWRRTSRIQIKSDSIIGDRFILAPHASCFIDALFSTGINMTTRFIIRSIPLIKKVCQQKNGPLDMSIFKPMEEKFYTEIDFIDKMVNGMIKSFRHPELFRQYWRIWIDATTRQIRDVHVTGDPTKSLYGSWNLEFRRVCYEAHDLITKSEKEDGFEVAKKSKQF